MRQRLLTGMCVMTMGLVLGVLWNVQDTQANATSTPTPVDSADLRVFPNDLTCDRREDTLSNQGPSWLGITMGQSTLEDVEELISTFDDEYAFVDDGNYDTRFVISTIIQDEPRFPSSVRLCLERNVVQVIAVGYYNGLLAPRPSLSDFVAQFGVPDAITWTDNPASRVAFWFEQGIATVVTVIPNTPGYTHLEPTFGRVEVEIYFPYQNVEDYEDRWPYNQTRKFNEFLVHPEEADFGPENPFDFEEMIATITAEPSRTPTPVDSDDLRVFPGDLVCNKREETISSVGPTWMGITIGQSTLADVEQLLSTLSDDYVFIDDDDYDTRFVIWDLDKSDAHSPSLSRGKYRTSDRRGIYASFTT